MVKLSPNQQAALLQMSSEEGHAGRPIWQGINKGIGMALVKAGLAEAGSDTAKVSLKRGGTKPVFKVVFRLTDEGRKLAAFFAAKGEAHMSIKERMDALLEADGGNGMAVVEEKAEAALKHIDALAKLIDAIHKEVGRFGSQPKGKATALTHIKGTINEVAELRESFEWLVEWAR